MKLSPVLTAALTASALTLSSIAVPSVVQATPLTGDPQVGQETNNELGLQTITVVDKQTLLPGEAFTVKVLFVEAPGKGARSQTAGVGFDKALWDSIDQANSHVKQYTTADEIEKNFPDSELAKLPSTIKTSLKDKSWKLKDYNRMDTKNLQFSYHLKNAKQKYFAHVSDMDYGTINAPKVGDDGIIALEFTFTTKNDLAVMNKLNVGGFFSAPIADLDAAWFHFRFSTSLGAVTVDTRKKADVAMLTPAGTHASGDKIQLQAQVTPADSATTVTFNDGVKTYTAPVVDGTASLDYTMGEKAVNINATIAQTDTYTGAISDYVLLSLPKPPAEEPTDEVKPEEEIPSDPSTPTPPADDDKTETSSVGDYWWAIVIGVLALLGIGGGAFAWANGLIPGMRHL